MGALNISVVSASQDQKEQTMNDATSQLEDAITSEFSINLASSDYTLAQLDYQRNFCFLCQNNSTVGRKVTITTTNRPAIFTADASNTVAVIINVGTATYTLNPSSSILIYTDGTTNGMLVMALGAVNPSVATCYMGKPPSGATIVKTVFAQAGNFPINFAGSQAVVGTAPAVAQQFNVHKNGTLIGTVNFAMGATTATFTMAGATAFAPGDVLDIVAPNPQDTTMADVAITLKGG